MFKYWFYVTLKMMIIIISVAMRREEEILRGRRKGEWGSSSKPNAPNWIFTRLKCIRNILEHFFFLKILQIKSWLLLTKQVFKMQSLFFYRSDTVQVYWHLIRSMECIMRRVTPDLLVSRLVPGLLDLSLSSLVPQTRLAHVDPNGPVSLCVSTVELL